MSHISKRLLTLKISLANCVMIKVWLHWTTCQGIKIQEGPSCIIHAFVRVGVQKLCYKTACHMYIEK